MRISSHFPYYFLIVNIVSVIGDTIIFDTITFYGEFKIYTGAFNQLAYKHRTAVPENQIC